MAVRSFHELLCFKHRIRLLFPLFLCLVEGCRFFHFFLTTQGFFRVPFLYSLKVLFLDDLVFFFGIR